MREKKVIAAILVHIDSFQLNRYFDKNSSNDLYSHFMYHWPFGYSARNLIIHQEFMSAKGFYEVSKIIFHT